MLKQEKPGVEWVVISYFTKKLRENKLNLLKVLWMSLTLIKNKQTKQEQQPQSLCYTSIYKIYQENKIN